MQGTQKITKEKIARYAVFGVCQLFSVFSFIYFLITGKPSEAFAGALSVAFVCLPYLAEKLFKMQIALPMYAFILLYAVCPMLGHSYKFYYFIPWWDTLLHTVGGVVFAVFGAFLPKTILKKERVSIWLCALFGLFFSVSVSAFWEIIEYTADSLFLTDMQQDTFVHAVYSHLLGDELGGMGRIEEIFLVTVNGTKLEGYIDLGIIDTMTDIIFETLGALVYAVFYLIDKGKHISFRYIGRTQRIE